MLQEEMQHTLYYVIVVKIYESYNIKLSTFINIFNDLYVLYKI